MVFFYAGHGSQRVNSLADVKLNHLDQTIVPADANAGQFDIRNTELAALFDRLIDKGATLTLIFDSCHSGSITRGETVPTKKRWAQADPRDARDAVRPTPPETRGALFIAAAADFEAAQEAHDDYDQKTHGAFTSALLQVMRQSRASAPADRHLRVGAGGSPAQRPRPTPGATRRGAGRPAALRPRDGRHGG